MNAQELINTYLNSWYQTIEFEPGVKSKGCLWCGDPAWENIKKFLPDNFEGQRLLDIGCNAGIFCVRSAMKGASCVGIESNKWRDGERYYEQSLDVKKYFESYCKHKLDITYIEGDMDEVLKKDIGKFDYCLGIASLYYSRNPEFLVKRISEICKRAIVRLRDDNRIALFTHLFEKYGFVLKDKLQEKWWEKLEVQTDDFYLFSYENVNLL